jgi:hypothetical protein
MSKMSTRYPHGYLTLEVTSINIVFAATVVKTCIHFSMNLQETKLLHKLTSIQAEPDHCRESRFYKIAVTYILTYETRTLNIAFSKNDIYLLHILGWMREYVFTFL